MNADEQAVAAVLAKYQNALNQSDTDAVMKLYASDGVFMPQHFPSSVGAVGQPRAFRVSEDRRHLEDRALLFFHHQPAARMRTKKPNDDHDESSSDSRSRWAGGSQN